MAYRGHRRVEIVSSPEALLRGFREVDRSIFFEDGTRVGAGERLALAISAPPLVHKALVRGIVSAVRRVGSKELPAGFSLQVHPPDLPRLTRLLQAASGVPTPFPDRRHARLPGLELAVRYAVGFASAAGTLVNASLGGAHVEVPAGVFVPRKGVSVRLEVSVPGLLGRTIALDAKVAWADPDAGFGAEWVPEAAAAARKLVDTLHRKASKSA